MDIAKTTEKVNTFKKDVEKIKQKYMGDVQALQDKIQKLNSRVGEYKDRTQKFVDSQVAAIRAKIQKKIEAVKNWAEHQLSQAQQWLSSAQAKVKETIKKAVDDAVNTVVSFCTNMMQKL